ncbi:MAG TPA: hypothetical protein VIU61_25765 [Kofleriaceae bacterium]
MRAVTAGDGVLTTGSRSVIATGQSRGRRFVFFAIVVLLTVGLAAVWSFMAQRQLTTSVTAQQADDLIHARKSFELVRSVIQDNLDSQCRVMVEDPRLKSTLATEGMDEATVADILSDLGKLRRTGFLIVLSPEGRVFAQAGADELRGLDLSASSVFKKAQSSPEAVVGSWVINGKIMDLSLTAVKFDTQVIAYLVVGRTVDQRLLAGVAAQSGVGVASAIGNKVVMSSSDSLASVVSAVASEPGTFDNRVFDVAGQRYVASVSELEETAQTKPRLVIVKPLEAPAAFETLKWMLFVPPLLVFIAVLFSMTGGRRTIVVTRAP